MLEAFVAGRNEGWYPLLDLAIPPPRNEESASHGAAEELLQLLVALIGGAKGNCPLDGTKSRSIQVELHARQP